VISRQSLDLGKVAQGLSPNVQRRSPRRVIGISESSGFSSSRIPGVWNRCMLESRSVISRRGQGS
jgi:hypothetical protein